MATPEDIHEANRRSWNHATARHNAHKGDQAKFLEEGGNTLFPEEMELLGDLTGKSLVHLLCNSGQDTLSIAKHLGAHVLGVDISDEAITAAGTLSNESGIEGKFVRSDIYGWFEQPSLPSVDVVFASYGALLWMSDLTRWGHGVSKILKPGGRVVIIEFHPMFDIFDDEGKWTAAFDYMGGGMVEELEGVGDYVGDSGEGLVANPASAEEVDTPYENPHPAYSYSWGLASASWHLLVRVFK